MKDQYDFQELDKHFDSSYESDMYRIAPGICRTCGALVAWDYSVQHVEWHKMLDPQCASTAGVEYGREMRCSLEAGHDGECKP